MLKSISIEGPHEYCLRTGKQLVSEINVVNNANEVVCLPYEVTAKQGLILTLGSVINDQDHQPALK